MYEFPIENLGPHIEEILTYAIQLLDLFENQHFLWVLAGFVLITMVLVWMVKTVQKPPTIV